MERIPFEPGRAVISLQGRDRGRAFVVLQTVDDEYMLIADGDTRKLEHPKKKKTKHLHPKPVLFQEIPEKMAAGQLLNSDIRKALKAAGLDTDQPLCEEG